MHRHNLRSLRRSAVATALLLGLLAGCGEKPEAMIASAKEYLSKGDSKAAVIQLKNALQKNPDLAEARFYLGKTLLETGDPASAEKELRRASDLGYAPDQAIPLLAEAILEQGDFKKVLSEFGKKELTSADSKADLLAYLGFAQLGTGKLEEAKNSFAAAVQTKSGHPRAKLGQARIKAMEGDVASATQLADEVIAKNPSATEALAFKAEILSYQNKADEAAKAYEKIVELKPENVKARFNLIALLMRDQKFEAATAQLEAMKKVAPRDPYTLYSQALLNYRQKNLVAARESIQQVLRLTGDHAPSLLLAGIIEFESKNYAQAEPYLQKAVERMPNHILARRLLAVNYLRTGQPHRAVEIIRPLADRLPNDPDVLLVAGEAYLYNNDVEQASKYYEQAASIDKKSAVARTRLGVARLAHGDTDAAFRDLEAASEIDSTQIQADVALLVAHLRAGQTDKALAAAESLVTKQPNNPLSHNLKAAVLMARNDVAGARKNFQKALELQPDYFPAAMNLARLDAQEKNYDAARKRFTDLLAKDPKNAQALLALAQLKAENGAPKKDVLELVEHAVSANPQATGPRVTLIRLHQHYGDPQKALATAQEAQAAIPDNPEILDALGRALQTAGDTNQAVATYNKLANLQPRSITPLLRLAELYVATKNYDGAFEALQRVLKMQPGNADALRGIVGLYVATGRHTEALAAARNAQKQAPKSPVGLLLEGEVFAAQKKWADSATAFRDALKKFRTPDFAMRLYEALSMGGRNADAEKVAADWLKDHPKDAAMRAFLADRGVRNKQYDVAARHYKAIIELQPKNASALNNLAWTAGQIKDPKAVEYAERAFALQPENPAVMDTLGMLLTERGDAARGLELLQKAVTAAPEIYAIRFNFAKALVAAGKKDQAKVQLDTLLKAGDKFAGREEAAALMKTL